MNLWIDSILIFLVLTNLALLGTSRIAGCIRIVAIQGILLGLLSLVVPIHGFSLRFLILAVGSTLIKGWGFPWLLSRALREANVRHEVDPYVGYPMSLMIGVFSLSVAVWLGSRLPLPNPVVSSLVVPVAFFMIFIGLFLIVSRRIALTQVLGYLVLENGIYTFGVALAEEAPLIVELGILLDVFVAVFVMGIALFHISREFDHIETDRLSALKDWTE